MDSRTPATLCLALAALLAFASPAGAAPAWQAPQTVAGEGYAPNVVMAATGHALATWMQDGPGADMHTRAAYYAWRSPDGRWDAPHTIPGSPRELPAVDLSAFGTATLAYGRPDGDIAVLSGRPGGQLRLVDELDGPKTPGGLWDPRVALAVDDEGGATIAWVTAPHILVAARRPGERFGVPQRMAGFATNEPYLAVNPAGAAVVAWSVGIGAIKAAYRLPGETRFGRVERVPRAAPSGSVPLVAIEDDGTAIVASWGEDFRRTHSTGVTFSERPPTGSFGPEQRVSAAGTLHALVAEPSAANTFVAQSGGAIAVATRFADGRFGPPTTLGAVDSCKPQGAASASGQLVLAWENPCLDNVSGGAGWGVQVSRRAGPAVAFDPPVRLTATGGQPHVAAGPGDDAIVIRQEGTPGGAAIRAAAFEDPAARPQSLVKPLLGADTTVTLPAGGRSLGIAITCPVACSVRPRGILATNGAGVATAATARVRDLSAKRRAIVGVRFPAASVRGARRALRNGRRASVSLTLTVRARGAKTRLSFTRVLRLRIER